MPSTLRADLGLAAGEGVVVVAPHLDDGPLSVGGTMHRLVREGTPVVLATVFTADPEPGSLSRLARGHHRSWRLGPAPFAPRRDEDLAATGLLGVRPVHLGLVDALYRRHPDGRHVYLEDIVGVAIDPADAAREVTRIAEAVGAVLDELGPSRLLCPLGRAGHVDHALVRAAAERLAGREALVYYEEFPYVWWSPRRLRGDDLTDGLRPLVIALDESDVAARIASIRQYGSQVTGLFPSPADRARRILADRVPPLRPLLGSPSPARAAERVGAAVRDHVARMGGERVWRA